MKKFFDAKSIAIVGVSDNPNKVGHVILRNIIDGSYNGKVYLVNRNGGYILGRKVNKSLRTIKEVIDLVVISIPAKQVLNVLHDCAKKKIQNVIIISAGFKEIGNTKLEDKIRDFMNAHKIKCIGVNCLGILNSYNGLDTLFLPRYRLRRPKAGGISFISQSGAVGSATLDLIGYEGYGVAKFISYGNATNIDETDLLDYLGHDKNTKVICAYIEGVQNGKKFLTTVKKVAKKKPVILLKAGITTKGREATISHTGSIAGSEKVYEGVFKQAGIIQVFSLREMFNVAKIFDKGFKVMGNKLQVITDGGGFGILAADAAEQAGLIMPDLSKNAKQTLQKCLPEIAIISNPLDLVGDADTQRYSSAIISCFKEKQIDIILVILLYQVPRLGTDAVDMIIDFQKQKIKPIIVVSPGGEFTQSLKRSLESADVPVYDFPDEAVSAIKRLVEFCNK